MLAIDVALGVREWYRCGRAERGSGGFDSYTNVSSGSDEFASSTALATFASKMSALEDAERPISMVSTGFTYLALTNMNLNRMSGSTLLLYLNDKTYR